jgi:uncharacterized alpha-E superfamily protein
VLLSRVAEQLYWAARYIERAEDTARVVGEHTHLLVDLPLSVPLTWEPLLAVTGARRQFDANYATADERQVIAFLLADRENPSSVLASVIAARENMRTAREVIPREAWQALNDLYLYATSHHAEAVDRRSRGRFLDKVVAECQRFVGIVSGTMSRDEAYQMLRLGRAIERADMTTRVLDVRAVALLAGRTAAADSPEHDEVQWAAVLRSLSALQAYHRRRRGPVSGHPTVAFLVRDPDFPGSIAHCLGEVEAVIADIPRSQPVDMAARAAVRTLAQVDDAPLDRLHEGLDDVQVAIGVVHEAVQATYFPPPPLEAATGATPVTAATITAATATTVDVRDVGPGHAAAGSADE